ncbi:MAG: hypothetical protein ACJA1N_001464 [Saprospiraceae bacterium]|jgi:hypothetical protein
MGNHLYLLKKLYHQGESSTELNLDLFNVGKY